VPPGNGPPIHVVSVPGLQCMVPPCSTTESTTRTRRRAGRRGARCRARAPRPLGSGRRGVGV